MRTALGEMDRRRRLQQEYNGRHGITPASIVKDIDNVLTSIYERDYAQPPMARERGEKFRTRDERAAHLAALEKDMHAAAANPGVRARGNAARPYPPVAPAGSGSRPRPPGVTARGRCEKMGTCSGTVVAGCRKR